LRCYSNEDIAMRKNLAILISLMLVTAPVAALAYPGGGGGGGHSGGGGGGGGGGHSGGGGGGGGGGHSSGGGYHGGGGGGSFHGGTVSSSHAGWSHVAGGGGDHHGAWSHGFGLGAGGAAHARYNNLYPQAYYQQTANDESLYQCIYDPANPWNCGILGHPAKAQVNRSLR
jgi:hypothetical protein